LSGCVPFIASSLHFLLQVPQQANGFDCGLFVTKFAEMVLKRQPGSSSADIAHQFTTLLPASDFSQQDVDLERTKLRRLLDR
jgi:Ulp1 family protease